MGVEKQGGNTALWKKELEVGGKRVRSWGYLTLAEGL
jgi:hypothetical protein